MISFAKHPDDIALMSSTGESTTKTPANTGLSDNFKVTFSPVDSFKKSIKRDSGIFTNFKEGKYWENWHRNTLATARAQNAAELLNSDYCAVTTDDVNLFKEK